MDLQRTLIIGGLVATGVLLLQQWTSDYKTVVEQPAAQTTQSILPGSQAQTSSDAPITGEAKQLMPAGLIRVQTDTLDMQIDTRGGDFAQVLLPAYPKYKDHPDIPFELLQRDTERTYIAQSGLVGPDGVDQKGAPVYQTRQKNYQLADGQDQLEVDLNYNAGGVDLTKRYTFTRGDYSVGVKYLVNNQSGQDWSANFYAQLKRDGSEDPSSQNAATSFNTFIGAAVRTDEKMYHRLAFGDFSDSPIKEQVTGGYAAILQHYFVTAWVPDQESQHTYMTRVAGDGNYIVGLVEPMVTVKPGESAEMGATFYAGPKDQVVLAELAQGLELTVDYGWLWWMAQPLFKLLNFIQSIVGNWGWTIILLTVCVKGALYPLSAAAYRSMANMRRVGPQLASLKEKYGDDKQKMGQEMMSLYKKEKINPMGGCLPIVIQMPVFIALYWVLLESVELRQAPWLGWIQDLSQMDPYFILPLIMGATMFLQQQLNPTPPDPVQAKVMKLMPVIFTVFFLWFPAGLVLYWVVNNTLSIIQQWLITRSIEKAHAAKS